MWALFAGSLAMVLINVFIKHWVLNVAAMLLMVGVVLAPGINVWMQMACILIMVWQFIAAVSKFVEDFF